MEPTLLTIAWKAYATGWLVAAPIGPVNLEIIRRGLKHNLLSAFMLGLGACCIDAIYLGLFSAGLGRVLAYPAVARTAFVVGGLFLCWLGIGALREAAAFLRVARDPAPADGETPSQQPGTAARGSVTPLGSFLVGLAMTASNPMTIAFWSALSLEFARHTLALRLLASGCVLLGCLSWILLIVSILAYARRWVGPKLFAGATLLGGAVVLYFGLSFLLRGAGVEQWMAEWM